MVYENGARLKFVGVYIHRQTEDLNANGAALMHAPKGGLTLAPGFVMAVVNHAMPGN